MSYVLNQSASYSLLIGGVDYSGNLISWSMSDASASLAGFATTTGTMVLGNLDGNGPYEDYDRNEFKRGTACTLDISLQRGLMQRHPRGFFYILSTSYNPETAELLVEIGCLIALSVLTDEYDDLLALAPLPLDVVQQTIPGIQGSFAAAGKVLYQDNNGDLQTVSLFDGDTYSSVAPGAWVSVLGETALSVQPLGASQSPPDEIRIGYSYSTTASEEPSRVDTAVTESYYWTTYPATRYTRTRPEQGLTGTGGVTEWAPATTAGNTCGNTPSPPSGSIPPTSCNDGYELVSTPTLVSAERVEVSTTEYNGPAAQVSIAITTTTGPALEANSQYYADEFAFCRSTYATACNPNGACPMNGLEVIELSKSISVNYYGDAGELVRTVTDDYQTELAGAQPFDWRSGVVGGAPQDFSYIDNTRMYRVSRTENVIRQEDNASIQETTTWNSPTTRQSGITQGPIDALNGLRTFTRRTSTSNSSRPSLPDSVSSPQTPTREGSTKVFLRQGQYVENPEESGPLVVENNAPVPFLFDDADQLDSAVDNYSDYVKRCVQGDSYGLQIGEAMRPEVVANWYPGMPFRYVDPGEGLILAMRMDACTWGLDAQGAAFTTDGLWIGVSDGTYVPGSNIVGNPSVGTPVQPPRVDSETYVNSGVLVFDVDIYISTQSLMTPAGNEDGISKPAEPEYQVDESITTTMWVTGSIFGPGSLTETDYNGGLPEGNNGLLVTSGAVIVTADLFSD